MQVIIDNESRNINFSGTGNELLKRLDIPREEVVIKINGKLAPETTELNASDKVEIIKVVFGG